MSNISTWTKCNHAATQIPIRQLPMAGEAYRTVPSLQISIRRPSRRLVGNKQTRICCN